MIQVKRVGNHDLPLPRRETDEAAGYDLRSAIDWILYPGEQHVFPTGFAWQLPRGWVGVIRDRSGIAVRARVTTCAGVIDSDYRGEVGVVLRNDGADGFKVCAGDRIAQMIVVPCMLESAEEVAELTDSRRGSGGYGSTGV